MYVYEIYFQEVSRSQFWLIKGQDVSGMKENKTLDSIWYFIYPILWLETSLVQLFENFKSRATYDGKIIKTFLEFGNYFISDTEKVGYVLYFSFCSTYRTVKTPIRTALEIIFFNCNFDLRRMFSR